MSIVTLLGNPVTIIILIAVVGGWAFTQKSYHLVAACVGVVGVVGVNSILKLLFQRMRPETDYVQNMVIDSYSFPSGHSCASMVGFGLLAYLSFQLLPVGWNVVACIAFIFLIFLVGISRIYLGAHFPSDVLGGWLVGGLGLLLIIYILKPLS